MAQKKTNCKKCQLGEKPRGGKILPLDGQFFSNFINGKNLTPFLPLMTLNKIFEKNIILREYMIFSQDKNEWE